MALNIADFFFCEELSRTVDHQTGLQWLLSRSTNQCSPGASSVFKSESSNQSADTSPNSQQSYMKSVVSAGQHSRHISSCAESCTSSFCSSLSSMDRFSLERTESASVDLDLALKGEVPYLHATQSMKPDPSMMGLLFTDAAHHVLDKVVPAWEVEVQYGIYVCATVSDSDTLMKPK